MAHRENVCRQSIKRHNMNAEILRRWKKVQPAEAQSRRQVSHPNVQFGNKSWLCQSILKQIIENRADISDSDTETDPEERRFQDFVVAEFVKSDKIHDVDGDGNNHKYGHKVL